VAGVRRPGCSEGSRVVHRAAVRVADVVSPGAAAGGGDKRRGEDGHEY
jgi:hypothetical protein